MSSLQNKLNKLSQSIKLHEQELNNAKKKEAAAKALESELKERVSVIQDQISVLSGQIASVQNSIGQKEQEISAKETEIAEKETEIEEKELEIQDQWSDFKKHMAAMQELRDGGSVAMLSAVNDLYELLTFNEVMQDISIKDTEILDNMKNAKEALESDKLTLESQRSELQSKKADLDAQNSQMRVYDEGEDACQAERAQLQRGRRPDERCRGAAGPEGRAGRH
jgi:peptidoglycan hydrolase CwlO-like protein